MYAKTYTYEDFFENEVTKTFYFHMTEIELMDLANSKDGGLVNMIESMQKEQDVVKMQAFFRELMDLSYGVRTENGGFSKDPEYLKEFKESAAYSDLFFLFASDEKEASDFINGIMPKKLRAQIAEAQKNGQIPATTQPIN